MLEGSNEGSDDGIEDGWLEGSKDGRADGDGNIVVSYRIQHFKKCDK